MRGKSFSSRLSLRIIGIVSLISILTQLAVAVVSQLIIAKELVRNPTLEQHPIDMLLHSRPMLISLIVIGLASLAAIFFACRSVINRMTRPVTELSKVVLEMAKGDLKAKLPEITSEDEMQHLRDSFQTMQQSLLDYIQELKATTAINERIQSDLDLARKIQKGMLLKEFPPFLYAMLEPAKTVGGDLYDFNLNGDQLYFAIGDVSGKGVASSIVMAITRVMLRFVVGMGLPLDETLRRINDSFSQSNEMGMFVTLFVARLDLKTGHMDFCNGGHNPLLIVPPDSEPYYLRCKSNLALGLFGNFVYEAEQIDLKQGTRIICYTDGVTEAEKADQSQYGEERLMEWAKNMDETCHGLSIQEKGIVESLYDSVEKFVDGNAQNDDITIVSLKL